ncbi:MAG: ABC transporter substrate-binding protein [Syntrophobacteraceae bacterium]
MAAENPEGVVKRFTDQVFKILNENPENTQVSRQKIREVADEFFDFEALARLSVGRPWKSLPPEKQKEFTLEFSKLLFNTYIGDIEKYARQKITYNNRSIYQGYVVVEALIRDQGGPISLDYYLHLKDGNWKVYNVAVGGMNLVTNYREQFDTILANGSFDDLSMMLRRQTAQVCGVNRC